MCSRCSAAVMFIEFVEFIDGAASGDVACPRRLATNITIAATTAVSRRIFNTRFMSVLQMLYFFDPVLRLVFFAVFFFGAAFFFGAVVFFAVLFFFARFAAAAFAFGFGAVALPA